MKTKEIKKVWGKEIWIANTDKYCGKILEIDRQFQCSMHYHKLKHETFYVLSGLVAFSTPKHTTIMKPGDSVVVPVKMKHQFAGLRNSKIIEFSTKHRETDSFRDTKSWKMDNASFKKLCQSGLPTEKKPS